MAILDSVTPTYYKILRMDIRQEGTDIVAMYLVTIFAVNGTPMATLDRGSVLTAQEKQAIRAIFQRDKTEFEAATGLITWVPPEEP